MHVFIAHANEDKRLARELAEKLRARDVGVFLDEDSLPAGEDYDARIRSAIGACQVFVFVASPSSIRVGAYALTELGIAKRRWPNPSGRVLPVAIGSVRVEDVPAYLTQGVTVLSPMGNVAVEAADEVERLLKSRRRADLNRVLTFGGPGVVLLASLLVAASSRTWGQPTDVEPAAMVTATSSLTSMAAHPKDSAPRTQGASASNLVPIPSPPSSLTAPVPEPVASSPPLLRAAATSPLGALIPAPSALFPLPKRIAEAGWTRLGADTFADASSWFQGKGDDEASHASLQIVNGRYRFSVDFDRAWRRWQETPYRSVIDLFAAVDVTLVSSNAEKPEICLLFGKALEQDYSFCVRRFSNGNWLKLVRYDGSTYTNLIDWTQTYVSLDGVNRMGVLVENSRIQVFMNARVVGEHRDPSFTGGKIALSVEAERAGTIVADFDNFEVRVPPE